MPVGDQRQELDRVGLSYQFSALSYPHIDSTRAFRHPPDNDMNSSSLFTCDRNAEYVLLVGGISALGHGTGVFLFDGEEISRIDVLPTAGIQPAGSHVVRLLGSDVSPTSCGEVISYDELGVERYVRVPNLSDAHDLAWDGECIICASTGNNRLIWLSPFGEIKREWKAPGEDDAWHINGLCCTGGTTYLSAFGMFARHRAWNDDQFAHSGIIYNLSEARIEIAGLDSPHNPVLSKEGWVVCNSGTAELFQLEVSGGALKRRLQLNGWTRGLAYSDEFFFVGESPDRKRLTVGASAHVSIVDRKSWTVCDRFAFPITEITFASLVPKRFVPSLRRGFRTNPYRESAYDIESLLRTTGTDSVHLLTTMEPLPLEAFKISIAGEAPKSVLAGCTFQVPLRLQNLGTGIFSSRPPYPIHLTYSWFRLQDETETKGADENLRTRLPRVVPPQYTLECALTVQAPKEPGTYRLQASLVQEGITRFDAVDSNNAYSAIIKVEVPALVRVSSVLTAALRGLVPKTGS